MQGREGITDERETERETERGGVWMSTANLPTTPAAQLGLCRKTLSHLHGPKDWMQGQFSDGSNFSPFQATDHSNKAYINLASAGGTHPAYRGTVVPIAFRVDGKEYSTVHAGVRDNTREVDFAILWFGKVNSARLQER